MIKKIFQNINVKFFITLVLVVFALYGKSLFFDFTYLDDDVLILDKQEYLSFSNIKNILTDTVFARGQDKFCRPLLNVSFLIEKYIYGIKPYGYHLTNVMLHIFAVFSVFLLLSLKYDKKKVFIVSILFACHPALTQAVVWIPGRNDSLLTVFAVMSFYFLIRYFDNKKNTYLAFHFFLYACSLLTKETAVMIPLFYFMYLLFTKQRVKTNVLFVSGWLSVGIFYFLYRSFVLSYQTYSYTVSDMSGIFFKSLPAATKYIANVFFPLNLSVFPSTVEVNYFLAAAVVFVFILLAVTAKKQYDKKILLFGMLWFIAFLLPTFVMPDNQFYDHRIYLPMVGIFIILLELVKSYKPDNWRFLYIFVLTAVMFFAALSFFHENKFKNKQIFWVNALIDSPDSDITNACVAGLLDEVKMYKESEKKYLRAIEIKKYSKHYVNLAVLYIHMKELEKAEQALLKALDLRDDNPMIYYNLAIVYRNKGNKELALKMKDLYLKVFKDTNKYQRTEDIRI